MEEAEPKLVLEGYRVEQGRICVQKRTEGMATVIEVGKLE